MSKVILVKANKGGVGKSWLTLQLAHATALKDKQVLIITSDSQNNIPRFAGIKENNFENGLEYWITKKMEHIWN
ncbi:AAA family ATPase [Fusobacterium sp. HC1336]|uniref:AAA family ATPase n=1 Tax=Fusobacterium sp. HC1336 TaxID=3171169 RepID=UPI003F21E660